MRFRKRYIAPAMLYLLLWGIAHLPLFEMRIPHEKMRERLQAAGQRHVQLGHYQSEKYRIRYIQAGIDTLPVAMIIHGSPGSNIAARFFLKDTNLTKKVQVLAPDRPGFGYSNFGKAEASLRHQAAALAPLLHATPRPHILVGHSYGGAVAVRMAIDYPELIDALVVVAGSVAPQLEPKAWWRAPLDWPWVRPLIPTALRVSNEEIAALYDELRAMEPLWPQLQCPIIVIQGQKDRLVHPRNAQYIRTHATNSPSVQVHLLPEGNHFIFWTRYELIRQAVVQLLER